MVKIFVKLVKRQCDKSESIFHGYARPKVFDESRMRVGDQITEAYRQQPNTSQRDAHAKALKMLEAVAICNPKHVMNLYPMRFLAVWANAL